MTSVFVEHVSKKFAKVEALKDLSFEVRPGELFGIIGPDGAGKTTLFRILATLLLPDSGSVRIQLREKSLDAVRDYKRLRQIIGYMPGRFSLYQDLSVRENLEFFAAVFGTSVQANYELVAPIYRQIEPFAKRRAGALSGGMKQKLALCCALIHRPELLLLDEPGTGVDPVSRKEFWDMLQLLREQGLTMLVSTPNMDEAALCDRIALLQGGQMLSINTPEGVTAAYQKPLFAARAQDMHRMIQDLRDWEGVATCFGFGEYAHLALQQDTNRSETDIRAYLLGKNHTHVELERIPATIEDCFIDLM